MANPDVYRLVEEDYNNVDQSFHNTYDSTKEYSEQLISFSRHLDPQSSVLIVGGTLPECEYFLKRGHSVDALDISQVMLDHITFHSSQVKAVRGNIKDFNAEKYDGVWACRALIHIPPQDMPTTLKNLSYILNPTGTIGTIFFTGNIEGFEEQKVPEEHTKKQDIFYYRVIWSRASLLSAFRQAGLSITKNEVCYDSDHEESFYIEATR